MAAEKIGEMYIELEARTKKLEDQLKLVKSKAQLAGKEAGSSFSSGFSGFMAATGLTLGISSFVGILKTSIDAAMEQERIEKQLNQTLISTKHAAGMSADELKRLATEMMKLTPLEDNAVLKAEALLLTFTRIGRDVFPDAIKVIGDMSMVMGDLESNTRVVGKALNNPIQGMAALQRVGIQLSDAQKEQIKHFVAVNDIMSAQKIIIDELNVKFGGQGKAALETFSGKMEQVKNYVGKAAEALGTDLFPAIENIAGAFGDATTAGDKLTPIFKTIGTAALITSQSVLNVVNMLTLFINWWKNVGITVGKIAEGDFKGAWESMKTGIGTGIEDVKTYGEAWVTTWNRIEKLWSEDKLKLMSPRDVLKGGTGTETPDPLTPEQIAEMKAKRQEAEKTVYESIKFLSDDYLNWKTSKINEEVSKIKEAGVSEIDAERYKYQQLRALMKEYADYWDVTARGIAETTIDVTGETIEEIKNLTKPEAFKESTAALEAQLAIMEGIKFGAEEAGYSIAWAMASQVTVFKQANSLLQQYINLLAQAVVKAIALAAVQKFITTPLLGFLGLGNKGGGFGSFGKDSPKKMASGGSFIVPEGYTNDSYPLLVRTGERVSVETPDKAMRDAMNRSSSSGTEQLLKILNANLSEVVKNTTNKNPKAIPIEGELSGTDIFLSNKTISKRNGVYS